MKEIDKLYEERRNFCVIALTGYTATGCSRLAEYMADKDFCNSKEIRNENIIGLSYPEHCVNTDIFFNREGKEVNKAIALMNFKKKFSICKKFCESNKDKSDFKLIKYRKVLWLMILRFLITNYRYNPDNESEKLKNSIKKILDDKFVPSVDKDDRYRTLHTEERWKDTQNILDAVDFWPVLIKELTEAYHEELSERQTNAKMAKIFMDYDSAFSKFYNHINDSLFELDYYCASFFYHRLAGQLRCTDDPLKPYHDVFTQIGDFDKLYNVVKFISNIIKGLRIPENDGEEKYECRVVIDRIRNSLEARYLKERYSAFYLIAVHDVENVEKHLRNKIRANYPVPYNKEKADNDNLNLEIERILWLGDMEKGNDDFEKGRFWAHNLEQCVADAEIHISNTENIENDAPYFSSMAEQWMKFSSLIFHPGLITPSSEERCMVVAYTAKFNSGCLSRQVGAVITNHAHSIRTIGWNDVPYGQVSCSLRSLYDFVNMGKKENEYVYSEFERGTAGFYKGVSFTEMVRNKYQWLAYPDKFKDMKGMPFSYCFKSFHNEFENKKNQVHTRSLHAEENAMLQMARFGGEGLENGIIYVTASPCELCSKKLYQIGIRKIIYIDEYPGIARQHIIANGFKRPELKQFQGAYGTTYFKLYQPLMSYKDEILLRLKDKDDKRTESKSKLISAILEKLGVDKLEDNLTKDQFSDFLEKVSFQK